MGLSFSPGGLSRYDRTEARISRPQVPDGFRRNSARVGTRLGAARTGLSVYELPPGQAVGPYHYEDPQEEWLLVAP